MKSSHTAFLVLITLLASSVVTAQGSESWQVWESLRDNDRHFSDRSKALGINQAYLEVIAEDAVVFRRGPVDAVSVYQRINPDERQRATLESRANYISHSLAGDLGLTSGPYRYTQGSGEELLRRHGHFISIWRRSGSEWRMVADMAVSIPGVLSLDVVPDRRETERAMSESPDPATLLDNTLAELLATEERFIAAINYRGGRRAILRYGMENQRIYVPGMAPGIGSAAGSTVYGAFLDDRMAVSAVTYQPGGGYMARSGEVGYTYGTMSAPESNFNTSYLRFWRFTNAGEWKIAVEVLNPF